MAYIQKNETVSVQETVKSEELGQGRLSCTQARVVFEGKDNAVADIAVESIDAMEYYSGDGITMNCLVGIFTAFLGLLLIMSVTADPSAPQDLLGVGLLVFFFGGLVALIFYDNTEGLRVHTAPKTWTFEGTNLRDFPHHVRKSQAS